MTYNQDSDRKKLFWLLLGCLILFLYGSWQLPFMGPDEPRYSQVARQMFETGDYIVPRLGNNAWFEKPVLLYWLISIFYSFMGVHEFAARVPSALSALGIVWLICDLVTRASSRRAGILSGLVLGTTAFFISFAHAAAFDMLVTFCVTAALYGFISFEWQPARKIYLWVFYSATALGVLAKGLVSPVVIGLAIGSYLIVSKKWRSIRNYQPFYGLLITAAVVSIWLLPITLIYGIRFWDEFFYQHHFVRYTTTHFHRSEGYFFYLPILLVGMYPWSTAILMGKSSNVTRRYRILRRICWCWFLTSFLFFSLSRTKLPGYILPSIPPFAVLTGMSLMEFLRRKTPTGKAILLISVLNVFLVLGVFWGSHRYEIKGPFIPLFIGIIILLTGLASYFVYVRKPHWVIASTLLIPISGIVIFLNVVFPTLAWSESKELSLQVKPYLENGTKLVVYNIYDFSPVFYTNARVDLTPEGYLYTIKKYDHLHRYVSAKGKAFVFVSNEELDWIRRAEFLKVGRIFSGSNRSIVELTSNE